MIWLTGQSIGVIALVVFGAVYLLGAAIVATTWLAQHLGLGRVLEGAAGMTVQPISVIFALVVGFVAADVWPNSDRARFALGVEAARLREAVVVAEALPNGVQDMLRAHVREHIDQIVRHEWPAMASRTQTLREPPAALHAALRELLMLNLPGGGQQMAQARAVAAVEEALDARRTRIVLSLDTIGPIKALLLLVLTALVMLTLALMHFERRGLRAAAITIFATAAAACMLAIVAYDRPFGGGGISLSPTLLLDVRPD